MRTTYSRLETREGTCTSKYFVLRSRSTFFRVQREIYLLYKYYEYLPVLVQGTLARVQVLVYKYSTLLGSLFSSLSTGTTTCTYTGTVERVENSEHSAYLKMRTLYRHSLSLAGDATFFIQPSGLWRNELCQLEF
jgi:hypothetical protein